MYLKKVLKTFENMRNGFLASSMVCEEITIPKCLQEMYSSADGDTFFEKFNGFTSCKCCPRHQILKPTHIHIPFVDIRKPINKSKDPECKCYCRQNARHLNRLYFNTFKYE